MLGKFITVFIKLVPFIFQLVKAAETLTDKAQAGAEKKEAVKAGAKAMLDGWKEVSTGGQKETAEKVEPLAEALIDKGVDLAAAMLFK